MGAESWIASPYKDLASIYLMMIKLLLKENYSAFESIVSTFVYPNCDIDFDTHGTKKDLRSHGRKLANYLTLEVSHIESLPCKAQPDQIDYKYFKKGLLNQRLKILQYIE